MALPLDLDGIMTANLALRTASRVLLRLGSFPAAAAEIGPGARAEGLDLLAEPPMSYVVLARKWRPMRFEDLVGQDHVARTLGNAIEQSPCWGR